MKLRDWRKSRGVSPEELAERLGCHRTTVVRYELRRVPDPEMMRKIVLVTDGAVQPNDFYDLGAE